MAKDSQQTNIGKNALKAIAKDSPIAKINVHKSNAAIEIQKKAFTGDKVYDQEVVLLSTDDVFGVKNKTAGLFGLQPAVKAKRYDELSAEPELDDLLERLVDECIVYDSESNRFCFADTVQIDKLKLDDKAKQELKDTFNDCFNVIYDLYAFNGLNAEPNRQDIKRLMREYFVKGRIAFEIVYDNIDEPTTIIGFRKLNPFALTPKQKGDILYWEYDKTAAENYERNAYSQLSVNMASGAAVTKRILLDSQVVYLQWNDDGIGTMSYLERLVRAFNLLRIIERSRIAYATTASRYKTHITIPVKGKTKTQAQETLRKAMNKYHEKIEFDDRSGELQLNGSASIPFNSEFWMAETNAGKPTIQNIETGMPDLSDTSAITYFRNNLQRMSKFPLSRFDEGGGIWNVAAESIIRDERRFAAFVAGIMHKFGVNIILKPTYTLMCLNNNTYIGDNDVLNSLMVTYNKYNQYQVQMELDLMSKRIQTIEQISNSLVRSIQLNDTEKPFWSADFLIQKYLGLSDSDMKMNAEMLQREQSEIKKLAMEQAKAIAEQAAQAEAAIATEEVGSHIDVASTANLTEQAEKTEKETPAKTEDAPMI